MPRSTGSRKGYNYGNGYITWAIRNYGGYSEANALQFSQEQAASHGWARYGDPEYVPHVLRYYSGGGGLFAGLFGNGQIVTVAKAQLDNEGGQKFWSWYGFGGRVERCDNGIVYTVEGNSGDAVRERSYPIDSESIMGYGVLSK